MGVQWWMYIAFLFIALTLSGGILDQQLATSPEQSAINEIVQLQVFSMREFDVLFFDFTAPVPNLSFFSQLGNLMVWNFSFFSGNMNIVRWLVWLPLTAGLSWVLVTAIGPVLLQVVATARGLFRL